MQKAIQILSGAQTHLEEYYINNNIYRCSNNNDSITLLSEEELNLLIPPKVDSWKNNENIVKEVKGSMILPITDYYGCDDGSNNDLNYFILSGKRCYNGNIVRSHCSLYLNYFEEYYDTDKELVAIYSNFKYLMDYEKDYTKERFINDLDRYILKSPDILTKVYMMNNDNFIPLSTSYKNTINPALQYDNKHCKIMMEISLLMNLIIPLLTHFIYVNNIKDPDTFLLEIFDKLLHRYDVDIYNKLYETAISIISKSSDHEDIGLWEQQDIRSKNKTTHAIESVANIILNIMPKYCYDQKVVFFNLSSIKTTTKFQIIDVGYEYDFIKLSSSRRDEDNVSEFDKYESFLTKRNESLFLQNKVNAQETMKNLELMFGAIDQEEIDFYIYTLGENVINSFQKILVFNLFYKYFGTPQSINSINKEDYIKLLLIGKKILEANNMVILPYILSGKVERLVTRNNVNKNQFTRLTASKTHERIQELYRNEKIEKYIYSIIATILCSSFSIIDYNDSTLHGKDIPVQNMADYISEEILVYVTLI